MKHLNTYWRTLSKHRRRLPWNRYWFWLVVKILLKLLSLALSILDAIGSGTDES
jgi:hypothetical protein